MSRHNYPSFLGILSVFFFLLSRTLATVDFKIPLIDYACMAFRFVSISHWVHLRGRDVKSVYPGNSFPFTLGYMKHLASSNYFFLLYNISLPFAGRIANMDMDVLA